MPADEFKPGKKYTIMTAHKFEGEFKESVLENDVIYLIFKTPGSNRFGENERKVPLGNVISSELTKT